MNENILQINQDFLSTAVAPFPASEASTIMDTYIPTHWSGPLAGGETVVMIINPYDYMTDVAIAWRDVPAFKNSTATMFYFEEVSTQEVWRSGSSVGFWYSGVPAHGSVVLIVWEAGTTDRIQERKTSTDPEEWARGFYPLEL